MNSFYEQNVWKFLLQLRRANFIKRWDIKNGEQTIPEEEIRAFLNDVIPSDATMVSINLYDNREANSSLPYIVLNISYNMYELEIGIACYDTGSVIKVINKDFGKTIYENKDNEYFRKYILRRNWFVWMQ